MILTSSNDPNGRPLFLKDMYVSFYSPTSYFIVFYSYYFLCFPGFGAWAGAGLDPLDSLTHISLGGFYVLYVMVFYRACGGSYCQYVSRPAQIPPLRPPAMAFKEPLNGQ